MSGRSIVHDRRRTTARSLSRLEVAQCLGGSRIALRGIRIERHVGDAVTVTGGKAEQQKDGEVAHHNLGGVAG